MHRLMILAALLGMLSPALAQTQQRLVDARNPQAILEIARGYGSAELDRDGGGDPRIMGRMEGQRYMVAFFGCKDGRNCTHIVLRAAWANTRAPLEAINAYNARKAFGVVFLDKDGDVAVDMAVNLANGGVTRRNLDDTFDWWRIVLRDVVAEFVERKGGEAGRPPQPRPMAPATGPGQKI